MILKTLLQILKHAKESDSENIAIAKGKYKFPENIKDFKNYTKRLRHGN